MTFDEARRLLVLLLLESTSKPSVKVVDGGRSRYLLFTRLHARA